MKEQTKNWLDFTKEDLKMAELAFEEEIYNQVCFHSQQAVEKILKALIEEKEEVPKEHRLLKLSRICGQLRYNLEEFQEDFEFLDKFYTSTRYPFIIGMLPEGLPIYEDAKKSIELAKKICVFLEGLISKK
jgi:HEPN domain-containing protein